MTRKYDGQRMTNQFYEDVKPNKSGMPTLIIKTEPEEKMTRKYTKRNLSFWNKDGSHKPKGAVSKINGHRARRKRDYIDVTITKRELDLLKSGRQARKAINSTGKWLSIRLVNSRLENRIKKLQKQIATLQKLL